MIKEAAASIKKVWNYEKTINVDIRALQNMLVIFAIVMLLIDVENFKLGKYVIGGATLFAAVVCILCAAVLKVPNNYHIDYDGHYYSVLYTLFRETYHSVTSRFFSNNTCWKLIFAIHFISPTRLNKILFFYCIIMHYPV